MWMWIIGWTDFEVGYFPITSFEVCPSLAHAGVVSSVTVTHFHSVAIVYYLNSSTSVEGETKRVTS